MVFNIQPESTQDIENLLRTYLASAALATALKLSLFHQLAVKPLELVEVSRRFKIPNDRCYAWLELLCNLGLLIQGNDRYSPSSLTQKFILDAYDRETWAFIAQESSEGYQAIIDLPASISHPSSVWEAQGMKPIDYITRMTEDSKRAKSFTRMLYNLHKPLAEKLANVLEMKGIERIMDLGGGSGVISLELLKKYEHLLAVVVDIDNVCASGREIADQTQMASRITYHPVNFMFQDLPSGFDLILECDVGVYQEDLFVKALNSLNVGGRFIIISNTNEQGAWLLHAGQSPSIFWFLNKFLSSLAVPKYKYSSVEEVENILIQVGFQNVKRKIVEDGIVMIEAFK
ncbi:MAG: methyltransferase [Candidatus Hodarchaeales archaeon]|jgi:hypothetical protein